MFINTGKYIFLSKAIFDLHLTVYCYFMHIKYFSDDELMEFEQVIELDSVKSQNNTDMVLKVNKLMFVI